MDADIIRYERALLRAGKSPREVACGLLGIPAPARFLLVVAATSVSIMARGEEDGRVVAMPFGMERGQVELQMVRVRVLLTYGWLNAWAAPMVSVFELDGWASHFATRGFRWGVWDTLNVARASIDPDRLSMTDLRFGWEVEVEPPQTTGGGGDLSLPIPSYP